MAFDRFSVRLPVLICGLGLSLSGCVAAPLAQLALSQGASADRAGTLASGPLGDLSKGVTDSFHKWADTAPPDKTAK